MSLSGPQSFNKQVSLSDPYSFDKRDHSGETISFASFTKAMSLNVSALSHHEDTQSGIRRDPSGCGI